MYLVAFLVALHTKSTNLLNVSSGQENLAFETATSGMKSRYRVPVQVLKLRVFEVRNGGLCSDSRDFSRQGVIPNSRSLG